MPPPKEEPEEIEDEEEFDEMDEDGVDMAEMFSSLLATDDGEAIAEIAKRHADAAEKIALNIEMQNKILVKILSALTKLAPAPQAADAA